MIVSTVATNLKDCGPFASQHRADLITEDLRTGQRLCNRARTLRVPATTKKR